MGRRHQPPLPGALKAAADTGTYLRWFKLPCGLSAIVFSQLDTIAWEDIPDDAAPTGRSYDALKQQLKTKLNKWHIAKTFKKVCFTGKRTFYTHLLFHPWLQPDAPGLLKKMENEPQCAAEAARHAQRRVTRALLTAYAERYGRNLQPGMSVPYPVPSVVPEQGMHGPTWQSSLTTMAPEAAPPHSRLEPAPPERTLPGLPTQPILEAPSTAIDLPAPVADGAGYPVPPPRDDDRGEADNGDAEMCGAPPSPQVAPAPPPPAASQMMERDDASHWRVTDRKLELELDHLYALRNQQSPLATFPGRIILCVSTAVTRPNYGSFPTLTPPGAIDLPGFDNGAISLSGLPPPLPPGPDTIWGEDY